jgi:hypothetical protein
MYTVQVAATRKSQTSGFKLAKKGVPKFSRKTRNLGKVHITLLSQDSCIPDSPKKVAFWKITLAGIRSRCVFFFCAFTTLNSIRTFAQNPKSPWGSGTVKNDNEKSRTDVFLIRAFWKIRVAGIRSRCVFFLYAFTTLNSIQTFAQNPKSPWASGTIKNDNEKSRTDVFLIRAFWKIPLAGIRSRCVFFFCAFTTLNSIQTFAQNPKSPWGSGTIKNDNEKSRTHVFLIRAFWKIPLAGIRSRCVFFLCAFTTLNSIQTFAQNPKSPWGSGMIKNDNEKSRTDFERRAAAATLQRNKILAEILSAAQRPKEHTF